MSDTNFVKITMDEDSYKALSGYLENDLPYLNGGIMLLEGIRGAADVDDEYKKALESAHLPEDTTVEDIDMKIYGTKRLISAIKAFVEVSKTGVSIKSTPVYSDEENNSE